MYLTSAQPIKVVLCIALYIIVGFGLVLLPQIVVADSENYTLPMDEPGDSDIYLCAWFDHDDSASKIRYDGETDFSYNDHKGTDFCTTIEQKEIRAAADGTVYLDGWENPSNHNQGYGYRIYVNHSSYDQRTVYAHATTTADYVDVSDPVSRGNVIILSGDTGDSTAPHLHFGVYDLSQEGVPQVDPYGWHEGQEDDPWEPGQSTGYLWTTDPPSMPFAATATTTVSGTISTNTTWASSTVYVIDGGVTVNSGVTLTIDPGTIIKFKTTNSYLYVNGTIVADGTPTEKIYFTSYKDDAHGGDSDGAGGAPNLGDWATIWLTSGTASSTMDNVVVRYGGYDSGFPGTASIYNTGGNLTLTNADIVQSKVFGLKQTSGTSNISSSSVIHNNGSDGVNVTGGTMNISNSTIYANSDTGINASGSGSLTLTGNTFYDNADGAVYIDLGSGISFTHSSNTASGDGTRAFIMDNSLGASQTWTADSMPYVASGVTIGSGKTLTINPGAIIKSEPGSVFYVQGTISAQGTNGNEIYFTSLKDDVGGDTNADGSATSPAAGDWGFIQTASGGYVDLDYAVVKYGGGSCCASSNIYNDGGLFELSNTEVASSTTNGIWNKNGTTTAEYVDVYGQTKGFYTTGGNLTVSTSTIHDNSTYGAEINTVNNLAFNGNSFYDNPSGAVYMTNTNVTNFTHSNNSASGSGKRGFIITSGVSSNQTWQEDNMPYILSGSITISSGKTLTVEPGAKLKFESTVTSFYIQGTLDAQGTSTNPIYFTSLKDDTVGGDTNADSSATSPAAGDWNTIQFTSTASGTIGDAVIMYGGATGLFNSTANIYNEAGVLNIFNSVVASSTDKGIYSGAGTTTASSLEIYGNQNGIYSEGGVVSISDSSIHDNSSYGINNTTGNSIDAEDNYWGASDGPGGVGPGSGDAVSSNVDYDPWLSSWP